jgi:hypothetical protein
MPASLRRRIRIRTTKEAVSEISDSEPINLSHPDKENALY